MNEIITKHAPPDDQNINLGINKIRYKIIRRINKIVNKIGYKSNHYDTIR